MKILRIVSAIFSALFLLLRLVSPTSAAAPPLSTHLPACCAQKIMPGCCRIDQARDPKRQANCACQIEPKDGKAIITAKTSLPPTPILPSAKATEAPRPSLTTVFRTTSAYQRGPPPPSFPASIFGRAPPIA